MFSASCDKVCTKIWQTLGLEFKLYLLAASEACTDRRASFCTLFTLALPGGLPVFLYSSKSGRVVPSSRSLLFNHAPAFKFLMLLAAQNFAVTKHSQALKFLPQRQAVTGSMQTQHEDLWQITGRLQRELEASDI